jgi:hypothetical protein
LYCWQRILYRQSVRVVGKEILHRLPILWLLAKLRAVGEDAVSRSVFKIRTCQLILIREVIYMPEVEGQ